MHPRTRTTDKKRDPLLAAVCHDLRAPLAAVTMGASFVLQTLGDDGNPRSRRILEAMLRSCSQMERLVRNFADLSEIESGQLELRMDEHEVGEMLEIAAQASREQASARNVAIEVVRPDTPVLLRCDRDRVLRAIGHVVDNAVRFAPADSTVTVAAKKGRGGIELTVTDRGLGLPEDVKENLFDRAWQAKRAHRVGAGFGLSIARGFVVAHGGSVDVVSESNVATMFTLAFPAPRVSSRRRRRP